MATYVLPSLASIIIAFHVPAMAQESATALALHAGDACSVVFNSRSERIRATKLDENRLQAVWGAGPRAISIEVRVGCGANGFDSALAEAGFGETGGRWVLDAGSRLEVADPIATTDWQGLGATWWLGAPCRLVVGKSLATTAYFTLDYCIEDDDFKANRDTFESLHRHFSVQSQGR